jgi:hypothetical protein
MALALWISPDSQYGLVAPGEARQGAYQRKVEQTLKRALFDDQDTTALRYEAALHQFNTALSATPNFGRQPRTALRELWQYLVPSDPSDSDINNDTGVSHRVELLFCQTLHALCAALAKQAIPAAQDPEDEADEDTEDEDEAAPTSDRPGAEYADVVKALANQLRQTFGFRWRQHPELERPQTDDWQIIARLLLEPLLALFADRLVVHTLEQIGQRDGRPHTKKRIDIAQPELAQRIERLIDILPLSFSPQPLKHPQAYFLDDPGPSDAADPYTRIDLIGYRQTNDFLRRLHHDIQAPEVRPAPFQRYVAAINLQQAVPWRINRPLLHWTRQLIAQGLHKTFEGSAEFLANPLARRALDELCPSDPQQEPPPFYLPWKADHRGRIYAETPWLTPQGGDLQRALLEFARGQVLTEAGAVALRRHGANLVKRDRLLHDLGIADRAVVTLDERERWILAHEADILASAADPIGTAFWREVADKPMQFLAFCLAYRGWQQHPDAPLHLPVQIDGTCNGIQHIAALTGDRSLAEAVNVLPRDDDRPADIYSELAKAALQTLGHLSITQGRATHRQGLALADAWLATAPDPGVWLSRKTAKKVVMTIPYGASRSAQARGVLEVLEESIRATWQERAPSASDLQALVKWKNAAQARRQFVGKCTKGLFHSVRQKDSDEWEDLRTFSAYVALTLVEHLRDALNQRYPKVGALSAWLEQTATACAGTGVTNKLTKQKDIGLPLLWLTPLGFPVAPNKFTSSRTSASAKLGAYAAKLDIRFLTEEVDPRKQVSALLPNLIHSLDATHLLLTLLEANTRGIQDIGSIHDCLLCHANQADTLSETVRQSFADLYAPDAAGWPQPLGDWWRWIQRVVALRSLSVANAKLVKGACDYPGKAGEQQLNQARDAGDEQARRAGHILEDLRRAPPPERLLLSMLLERQTQCTTPPSPPPLKPPPQTSDLGLSAARMSPYFFS